ncbi:aspartyl protease family protein [Sphingobacterium spiritivorum]|uniref:aspartyl protease family protein n=1 Tax=Sphingobacterium spiritivorum TaxID=258 RepID=UPI003DA4DE47
MTLSKLSFIAMMAFLFMLPDIGNAQNLNASKIKVSNFCDTIPFEYVKNKIIIKLTIENKERRFILDTGAPFLISEQLRAELNLKSKHKIATTDVTGKSSDIPVVKMPDIQIGNIAFSNTQALVYDLSASGLLQCFSVDGLLGSTILKHSIVQIDLEKKLLILTDKIENFPVLPDERMALAFDKNSRPFLNIKVAGSNPFQVLFDSGSDKLLAVSYPTYNELNNKGEAKMLYKGKGSVSSGLFGAGKEGDEWRILLNQIEIGPGILDSIITNVSEHKNKNAIGMPIGKYGVITLDYLHKHFYFHPYQTRQIVKNSNFYGFDSQLVNDDYIVSVVYEGSNAEKAGLKRGDVILQINDYKVDEFKDICQLFFGNYFTGESLNLTIKDKDNSRKTVKIAKE